MSQKNIGSFSQISDFKWLNPDLQIAYLLSLYSKITQGTSLNKLNLLTIDNYIKINLDDLDKLVDVKKTLEKLISIPTGDLYQILRSVKHSKGK